MDIIKQINIIRKIGYKARENWLYGSFFEKLYVSPYVLYLILKGKNPKKSGWIVKCNKFINYLTIWRCATTTIMNEIKNNNKKVKCIRIDSEKNLKKLDNKFIFTFVRNPYNRILSSYLHKIERDKKNYLFGGVMKNIKNKDISFEEFVKAINNIPDKFLDAHFMSYSLLIKENAPHIDFIGKLETFEKDWNFIARLLNYPKANKLKIRSKVNSKYSLKDYYTKELKEIIYNKYKRDFKTFGYKK